MVDRSWDAGVAYLSRRVRHSGQRVRQRRSSLQENDAEDQKMAQWRVYTISCVVLMKCVQRDKLHSFEPDI